MSRNDGKMVAAYLKSLKGGGGRGSRSPANLKQQLNTVNQKLASSLGSVARLKMIQKSINLNQRIKTAEKIQSASANKQKVENDFVQVAGRYSRENGISNTAWRRMGVPGNILIKAGVAKPRRK